MPVTLASPSPAGQREFLAAVRRSRSLHRPWVSPPATAPAYARYLERARADRSIPYLVCTRDGEMAGVIELSEVVRGAFCSAYIAFYAFVPHAGRGLMREALDLVVARSLQRGALHRLEANIQPTNTRSIALVRSVGFRREGFSPRYLKIRGRWRDHERWAITREDWLARDSRPRRKGTR